jgi:hypothetical protein
MLGSVCIYAFGRKARSSSEDIFQVASGVGIKSSKSTGERTSIKNEMRLTRQEMAKIGKENSIEFLLLPGLYFFSLSSFIRRFVMWQAYVLRKNNRTGRTEPVRVLHGPFSRYFSQDESDEGLLMLTDVPVNEVPMHAIHELFHIVFTSDLSHEGAFKYRDTSDTRC